MKNSILDNLKLLGSKTMILSFSFFMVLLLSGTYSKALAADTSISESISSNSDDSGTEPSTSCVYAEGLGKIYLGHCANGIGIVSGFRFANVYIPNYAIAKSAYLDMRSLGTTPATAIQVRIFGELSSNSATFSTSSRPIDRSLTSNYVVMDIPANSTTTTFRSPNLSAIINEITSQSGWVSGRPITLIIKPNNAGSVSHGFAAKEYIDLSTQSSYPAILSLTYSAMTQPTDLTHTCSNDGTSVTLDWDKSTNAQAYLVRLYNGSTIVREDMVIKNYVDFYNIQSNFLYSKWTVQPLEEESLSTSNIEKTADLTAIGTAIVCSGVSPEVPVVTTTVPSFTNMRSFTIQGTKPAGTSIYVNGNKVVGESENTNWTYTLPLINEGINPYSITANNNGTSSGATVVNITRCRFGDINCDKKVDMTDFSWLVKAIQLQNYSTDRPDFMKLADMDGGDGVAGDGEVNIKDFKQFRNAYLREKR